MDKLVTKHFKIMFNSSIGNLNNKKAEKLAEVFSERFETRLMQEQPFGNIYILVNPSTMETIIIEPDKIIYQIENPEKSVNPKFENIGDNIKLLFETLMLDENVPAMIHIVSHLHSKGNAMEESVTNFQNGIVDSLKSLKGIGLRYLLEHHTGLWEYKVEPLINNPQLYFVEMICNINKSLHINEIVELANESFVDFHSEKINVLEKLGVL